MVDAFTFSLGCSQVPSQYREEAGNCANHTPARHIKGRLILAHGFAVEYYVVSPRQRTQSQMSREHVLSRGKQKSARFARAEDCSAIGIYR